MRAALSLALVVVSVTSAVPATVHETKSDRAKAERDNYATLFDWRTPFFERLLFGHHDDGSPQTRSGRQTPRKFCSPN